MARRSPEPDFIESLARGLDVITAFQAGEQSLTMATIATRTGLARPTARRVLLTLQNLGYVRTRDGQFTLTPRVLDLGTAFVRSQGLWDIARPHMQALSNETHESTSVAQLDGGDIVYVARVAVPKIVALRVDIGSRLPALQTSLGKVLLASLPPEEVAEQLAQPSRSGITPRWQPDRRERNSALREVRARGWASTDQQLALGVRSVACPLRNGNGHVIAALNVNAHAAETTQEELLENHLPRLLKAASSISADFAVYDASPQIDQSGDASTTSADVRPDRG